MSKKMHKTWCGVFPRRGELFLLKIRPFFKIRAKPPGIIFYCILLKFLAGGGLVKQI
jgi:hypothetical protein